MRRTTRAVAAAALICAVVPATVSAHDELISDDGGITIEEHQHEGIDGHLPASSENVEVVGKLELSNVVEGAVADVGYHRGYAYLTRFRGPNCFNAASEGDPPGGVWIVDVRNPAKPVEVGYLPTSFGSYAGEGAHAIRIETASFTGDVLAINNETCVQGDDLGGVTLWNVTDPRNPVKLVEHFGDFDDEGVPQQIHSVFMWQGKAGKAYAVMTDDEESADLDILDISDPANPVLIAEYDLDGELTPQIVQEDLGTGGTFLHDMIVKKIKGRFVMLVSYWDGGYVQLDVTDPLAPVYISDTDFANPDVLLEERTGLTEQPEGNAHQAEYSKDNEYIIAADEDFNPTRGEAVNVDSGARLSAPSGSDTPELEVNVPIEGASVFAGRACTATGGDVVPPGDPAATDVAVVERGLCTFTEKVASVEAAGGYDAIIIFNAMAPNRCSAGAGGMLVDGNTPTFGVAPRADAFELFGAVYDDAACLAGTQPFPAVPGDAGATVRIRVYFDGWGYVRLFENGTGKLTELDQYAIPEAHDVDYIEGFGDLSVHEVAMSIREDDLGYLSYYSGGLRVIEIDDDEIHEVGHFIDEGGNNFWGVEVFKRKGEEYVLASDRDFGLYIFRYTGDD
jgi:hypothetical protein